MTFPLEIHKERSYFYSPLSFLHQYKKELIDQFIIKLDHDEKDGKIHSIGSNARFILRHLEWDSNYFSCPTYRLEFADWDNSVIDPVHALAETIKLAHQKLSNLHKNYYLFAEIPSEDITVLQSLGIAGFKLIETRLTYFKDNLEDFENFPRFPVRQATSDDIPNLRKVAMEMRNSFDRLHADSSFSDYESDNYLGTFIENSVKGFASSILVPDDAQDLTSPPNAFFTANIIEAEDSILKIKEGNIALVAVGKERQGWHLKLLSEMTYHFQDLGVSVSHMTTQSTNRAVIRNCEKLGYRYGRSTHVFATRKNK